MINILKTKETIVRTLLRFPSYYTPPRANAFLPSGRFVRSLAVFIDGVIRNGRQERNRISTTKKMRNTCEGSVLLLGNGPSARNLSESAIKWFVKQGGKVAVMNNFLTYKSDPSFEIAYYFLVDPGYWSPIMKSDKELMLNLINFVRFNQTNISIVQPASSTLLIESHEHYIFIDTRPAMGVTRNSSPVKPWGLTSSVALHAISTLKYLGFRQLFFAGLESNLYRNFQVTDLNEIYLNLEDLHSYEANKRSNELSLSMKDYPISSMEQMLYAASINFRDFREVAEGFAINVGGDTTNDTCPRASLIPYPSER